MARMFTDSQGREWSTAVTVETVARVKERAGVLLTSEADIERVRRDIFQLCNVLCAVCRPQADERGVSSSDFGALLVGDIIDTAAESLWEDLLLFFPSGRRMIIQRIMKATTTLEAKQLEAMESRLSDEAIERMVAQGLKTLDKELEPWSVPTGEASGSSPESSD